MEIDIESLERATLDAVAPAEVEVLPGWLLAFDKSTIGRATSAVPVLHGRLDTSAIQDIESRYCRRGLKPQYRIADVTGLSDLRQALSNSGYSPSQPTLTMVGNVCHWPQAALDTSANVSMEPTEAWRSVYLSPDFDPVAEAHRIQALSRSNCLLYACVCDGSGAIAAGTASFSRGWASLHGLRTIERERGKGHARTLIAALGREAAIKGYDRCFLQVEETNATAIRLYRQLGFRTAWRYQYWR